MKELPFGVQSWCFRKYTDNTQVAQRVKTIGLNKIELCGIHGDFNDPEGFKEVIKIYASEGVSITSIGVQTFEGRDHEAKWFESAALAGAKHLSAHVRIATYPAAIAKLRRWSREFGIKVGLHCHGGYMFGGSPDVLKHLVDLGAPEVGITIDTAWCMQIGPHQGNPVSWVEQFGSAIHGVHYKDFRFEPNGQWRDVVVGTGTLDLPAFVAALRAHHFQGMSVIEYEADADNPVPALTACVQSMAEHF